MLFAVAATTFVVWKTADDEIEWESGANRTHNRTYHSNSSGGSASSLTHHDLHSQSNNHSNNHSSNDSNHGGGNSDNYLAPPWTMWMLGGR
jgi:ABC-type nickel/cobalt efflux system permease component RcnA